jgi:hypothetical protein
MASHFMAAAQHQQVAMLPVATGLFRRKNTAWP